jgi:hypothetical protein
MTRHTTARSHIRGAPGRGRGGLDGRARTAHVDRPVVTLLSCMAPPARSGSPTSPGSRRGPSTSRSSSSSPTASRARRGTAGRPVHRQRRQHDAVAGRVPVRAPDGERPERGDAGHRDPDEPGLLGEQPLVRPGPLDPRRADPGEPDRRVLGDAARARARPLLQRLARLGDRGAPGGLHVHVGPVDRPGRVEPLLRRPDGDGVLRRRGAADGGEHHPPRERGPGAGRGAGAERCRGDAARSSLRAR